MSNSRPPCPRSVLVVSWILILLSLTLALLGVRSLWLLSKLPDPSVLPKDALVDLGIGLFSTLLTLGCGIFMLRGYNWARWIYTGWSFLGLVLSLVPEPWGMTFPPGRIVFLFVVGFLFSKPANEFFRRKDREPEVTDD